MTNHTTPANDTPPPSKPAWMTPEYESRLAIAYRALESTISDAKMMSIMAEDFASSNLGSGSRAEDRYGMPSFVLTPDQLNGIQFAVIELGNKVRAICDEWHAGIDNARREV